MATTVDVNGRPLNVNSPPDTPLLWVLRDELGLTGTKYGCGIAQCGACTVLADGQPIRAAVTCADGRKVIEQVVTRADLAKSDRVWLINAVRGWVPVTVAAAPTLA